MATGSEEPTSPPHSGIGMLRHGAIWVTLTSALALPGSYFRNLLLGQFDSSGEVAGTFAAILVLLEFMRTFVLFGGTSAVTHFLPRIREPADKANFLLAYAFISFAVAVGLLGVVLIWPEIFDLITSHPSGTAERAALSFLALIFLAQQLSVYALAGLMKFRLSSLITQYQLFAMLTVLGLGHFFFPEAIRNHTLTIFAFTIGSASLLGVLLGSRVIVAEVGWPKGGRLPETFWRFATQVHANSICAFVYTNVDQIYILAQLGRDKLGGYFLILQLSMLIQFVPQRIGQVLLASFSNLIAEEEHERLRGIYLRLCRLTILLATTLSLGMIFLSRFTVGIFGDWLVADHHYLVLLAAAANIGCVGSINSMLILSKEQVGVYLANNTAVIVVQVLAMILLIPQFGIEGAIWGRILGTVAGQVGLFWIVRARISEMHLRVPFEYWMSQVFVLGSAVALLRFEIADTLTSLGAGLAVGGVFLLVIRFKPSELRALLGR